MAAGPKPPVRRSQDALFRPQSVAIIGASSDPTRIGGRPIDYSRRGRFAGSLYPVNLNQTEVQGLPCYASLAAIPGAVDLALIALPAKAAPDSVEACIAKGVKVIVMFSSGFAEVDAAGRVAQENIQRRCAGAGIRLLGPNCLGVMNINTGMLLTFSTVLESIWPRAGKVSLVSQSGAVGAYCAALVAERGAGLSQWIATGNEADIDVAQCLEWFAEDPATGVIMVYLEGCRDLARLRAGLERAAANGKPVVVLKAGATVAGAIAVAAHTGSDAGSDPDYDSLFRDTGACRAATVEQAVDMVYACANGVFPAGPRLGVVSISGGVGVLMADAASRSGVELPVMPARAQAEIKKLVPFSSPANPVDVTAQIINDITLFNRILSIMVEQGGFDSVIIFLQQLGKVPKHFLGFREAMMEARSGHPELLLVLCGGYSEENRAQMESHGFLVFEDPARAVAAVAGLTRFGRTFAHKGNSGS